MNMITVRGFVVSSLVQCLYFEGSRKRKFDIPKLCYLRYKKTTGSAKVKTDLC